MKRVLTIAAILVCICLPSLAGGSPLFKSDHQSDGVNENTEVRCGIEHPSDVGTQKGASLSATDFLFDKQHEPSKQESWQAEGCSYQGREAAEDKYRALPNSGGKQLPPGIWRDGQSFAGESGARYGNARLQAAAPAVATALQPIPRQLTYGQRIQIQIAGTDRRADRGSSSRSGNVAQKLPQTVWVSQAFAGSVSINQYGDQSRTRFDGGIEYPVHRGQKDGFSQACREIVGRSNFSFNKPDAPDAMIGRPALFLSSWTHCSYCSGGRTRLPDSKSTPNRVAAMEVVA